MTLGLPRPSRLAKVSLADWKRRVRKFRAQHDLDFLRPVDFSRFLLLVYGPKSDPEGEALFSAYSDFRIDLPGKTFSERSKAFVKAWKSVMIPHGLVAARGLHSVTFDTSLDVVSSILAHADDTEQATSNYSQNVVVGAWDFAAAMLHRDFFFLDRPEIVRKMKRLDPTLEIPTGVRRILLDDDEPVVEKRKCSTHGKACVQKPQRILSRTEKTRLFEVYQRSVMCVTMISDIKPRDMRSFGHDSESWDGDEAEIKVSMCEPLCLRHVFVASQLPGMGKAVPREVQRAFALDEHIELEVEKDFGCPELHLHPDTPMGSVTGYKRVKNLPAGFSWYDATNG